MVEMRFFSTTNEPTIPNHHRVPEKWGVTTTHLLRSDWAWATAREAAVARRNFMRRWEGVGRVNLKLASGFNVEDS